MLERTLIIDTIELETSEHTQNHQQIPLSSKSWGPDYRMKSPLTILGSNCDVVWLAT